MRPGGPIGKGIYTVGERGPEIFIPTTSGRIFARTDEPTILDTPQDPPEDDEVPDVPNDEVPDEENP